MVEKRHRDGGLNMPAEKKYCSMELALDGIDEMQDILKEYPDRMPKSDVLKIHLWTAKHICVIYKILFYILTRVK